VSSPSISQLRKDCNIVLKLNKSETENLDFRTEFFVKVSVVPKHAFLYFVLVERELISEDAYPYRTTKMSQKVAQCFWKNAAKKIMHQICAVF